jgi:hypothetical protein
VHDRTKIFERWNLLMYLSVMRSSCVAESKEMTRFDMVTWSLLASNISRLTFTTSCSVALPLEFGLLFLLEMAYTICS